LIRCTQGDGKVYCGKIGGGLVIFHPTNLNEQVGSIGGAFNTYPADGDIGIFEDHIFWSSLNGETIYRLTTGGNGSPTTYTTLHTISSFDINHTERKVIYTSPDGTIAQIDIDDGTETYLTALHESVNGYTFYFFFGSFSLNLLFSNHHHTIQHTTTPVNTCASSNSNYPTNATSYS